MSWWRKLTAPPGSKRRVAGLPTSCISAANRSTKSGAGNGAVGARFQGRGLLQDLQGVLVDVLVPVVLVGFQPQGGDLGQHELGQAGVHQQVHARRGGGRRR